MALEHGASLIPAFCFGQSGTFHWIRPGPPLFSDAVVTWLASKLGFLPVYVYGYGFLPMPFRVRLAEQLGRFRCFASFFSSRVSGHYNHV